jgi:hypothetical protein
MYGLGVSALNPLFVPIIVGGTVRRKRLRVRAISLDKDSGS